MLNDNAPAGEKAFAKPKGVEKNSFQKMLAESEMKVSVAKKAPKKGMQLGKKAKKINPLAVIAKELEDRNVIETDKVAEEEKQTE